EGEQIYGVQPHHLLICDALGLDSSLVCSILRPKRRQGQSDPLNMGWSEGRRTRPRIGAYQVIPKLRVEHQGGAPNMELPGVAAVRWRRGNGAALIRAGEGADQRAADGFPPLPLICREGRPSRREVDGRAR